MTAAKCWGVSLYSQQLFPQFLMYNFFQNDYDHCNPDPCQNGASCFNTQADYYCHCPERWQGKNCSLPKLTCDNPPCDGKFLAALDLSRPKFLEPVLQQIFTLLDYLFFSSIFCLRWSRFKNAGSLLNWTKIKSI